MVSILLGQLLFAEEIAEASVQKEDVKQKVLFKGKESYDKRMQEKVKKRDQNITEDDIKKARATKKRIEDCARRKDGTIDFIKYKKCKETLE